MNLPFSFANLPVEEARRRELVGSSGKWKVTAREKKPEHHFPKASGVKSLGVEANTFTHLRAPLAITEHLPEHSDGEAYPDRPEAFRKVQLYDSNVLLLRKGCA